MIILRPYEPKIYPVVPRSEWREPSLSMPRDRFGNPEWWVRFSVSAILDGREVWRGWFDDRDDADAFLWAAVTRTLHIQRALCHLPDPIWSPGWYKDEDIVWQYATTNYFTSGTSTTIPSDWNNSNNTITAIGGGANGAPGVWDGKTGTAGGGGGGGACSRITNQSYTASASRTRQIGTAAADTFLKADNNSTNAILAKGGSAASGTAPGNGGAAASGTGTTKYSGGNGFGVSGSDGGGGGGAASATANGSNSSGTSGGASGSTASGGSTNNVGAAGTELGSGYGAGGGGGAGTSGNIGKAGGNYGGGGGGGGASGGSTVTEGSGAGGLLVMEYTPAAASMKAGFNMPNGW